MSEGRGKAAGPNVSTFLKFLHSKTLALIIGLVRAIICCRKGGTISMSGVYLGYFDRIPFGASINKELT
jgi:threonine dehydrogenase-like Zn-dependent dehydrogenase